MRRKSRATGAALVAGAALCAGLPAWSQQQSPESLLPPGFGAPAPPPRAPAPPAAPAPNAVPPAPGAPPPAPALAIDPSALAEEDVAEPEVPEAPPPPEELPPAARRPLDRVGLAQGYDEAVFGASDGRYVATLMRRLRTPIASRWAEIVLRRMLLTATPAPPGEARADWVADRAALLLRLGEADGGRVLVQAVDVDNFSPRLRRVAVQAALATSDPAALCPLPDGDETIADRPAWPVIRAMCAALSNDVATANATLGRAAANDPIDHALAEKLVAASGAGRQAVPIEWTAVDTLTDWRFGLATALNVVIPQALLDAAPLWFQAWLARAPMLSPADRIAPARIAAALGPVSSRELVDLYGAAADAGGDIDTDSPPGRLRAAYLGDDDEARLGAMRSLWDAASTAQAGGRDRYAAAILTAQAAARLRPDRDFSGDIGQIVGSLFAAGLDIQAERWAGVAEAGSGDDADRAWAMLAVGARRPVVTVTPRRIEGIAKRDGESGPQRAAMLAAALAGLGRMAPADAAGIAKAHGADLAATTPYARAFERAVGEDAPATVALLVAVGMQSASWGGVPPGDFYRMIQALRAAGLETEARMIAAEAMARL